MRQRKTRITVLIATVGLAVGGCASGPPQVSTLVELNASGGVTLGPDGFIYVSDFGPALAPAPVSTSVYRVDPDSGEYTVFASGFDGASGATFDQQGNFYQSEPRGNRVTRIRPDGQREVVAEDLNTPVGVQVDGQGRIFVANCGNQEILTFDTAGNRSVLSRDPALMRCPNGLTMDDAGNLYTVTFGAGNVLKVSPGGELSVVAELPVLTGGPNPVGLGHVAYRDGALYVTAIGVGAVYRVSLTGETELIAGVPSAFTNTDGAAGEATFSKPNGIAFSADGTRLFINVSEPSWTAANPRALHPAKLRVITGVR